MTDDIYLADILISRLNKMLKADPAAIRALIAQRIPCNGSKLEEDTEAQVTEDGQVGLLGVLNGVCGQIKSGPKKGHGWITAVYDYQGGLHEFVKTTNLDPNDVDEALVES